jgi:hypothetical protein
MRNSIPALDLDDDNDFFLDAPSAMKSGVDSRSYILEDLTDPLIQEFALDDATSDDHPNLVAIREYLSKAQKSKSISDVRYALKNKIDADYLSNTLILRCMCFLHNVGLGEVTIGDRTCRFQIKNI